ncbi:hypothetical protein ALP99_100326 [Pseudomonas syringae pv. tomato]|uniref:Uncharacterized protein n=3 Tax=Pseudomonas syringae group TaxID=136849 RepID=A0A0P9T9V4_PSEYM|nr:hypothetical protein ALO87_100305 [Pseudomonas syringae pv. apii]KPW51052.1 hypothetical protein ALO88_100301 [Pseudomonas syringae pv. antirrhini]KPW60598.1 hypothetical protein ALO86_100244 [Pseudomonas syringae pv. berberidis]KPX70641.1 hypothetical protein ALO84_100255 [Pseudomonas syringae pv. maculicola]KPY24969.1 hypothetical protein ALO54_100272 [Pseudomonas syringae pv. philadelphi]KPY90471.1 hypothetical protein ALO36_100583 [Pseudomonas syringae pv. tomato]RMM08452.1 hypothetica
MMRDESGPGEQKTIKFDEWRMFDYNFALPFCVERAAAYFPVLLKLLSQHRGV